MKLIIFYFIYFLCHILQQSECTQRTYAPEEENKHRMSYFLVENVYGSYELEDLTNSDVPFKATLEDVVYYLCTQSNRNGTIISTDTSLQEVFHVKKEVLVLIHGWRNDHDSSFNSYVKSAALDNFDVNVIVVDWSVISKKDYITARNAVPQIGKFVADFLQFLSVTYDIPLSSISIVGHSLGAHVSGNVGSTLEGKINHIMGLDPAGPLVSVLDKSYCLDSSDAQYVEVIHTNGALLGLKSSLGHSDYFPNGGKKQPGCGLDLVGSCSHGRSYQYYAESIRKNSFISQQCDSYSDFTHGRCNGNFALMGGYNIDQRSSGDFYLDTNENYPYAIS